MTAEVGLFSRGRKPLVGASFGIAVFLVCALALFFPVRQAWAGTSPARSGNAMQDATTGTGNGSGNASRGVLSRPVKPKARSWGRIGLGLWFLSSPTALYGGQAAVTLEGGSRPWVAGRVVIGGAVLPLSSNTLDEMSSFEAMTAAVFGVGGVFRISGLASVARALKVPLDLELALVLSTLANRPMVAVAMEMEFDVRYSFQSGWWIGGAVKGGWWHVMTEAVEGNFSLGPALGVGVETGWGW